MYVNSKECQGRYFISNNNFQTLYENAEIQANMAIMDIDTTEMNIRYPWIQEEIISAQ